jgi:aspartyl-tRNA synthetase
MSKLKSKYRSYTCEEIRRSNVGEEVTLSGWVMRKRDHGGLVFIDLRDNYGVTQVIFNSEQNKEIENIRLESVITVTGQVVARADSLINPKLSTGEIEVVCKNFTVQSVAEQLPFQISEDDNANEATRLKYRFLELRKDKLHKNILLRSAVFKTAREVMSNLGFTEFQTPILTSSSPEGARDFIVPSRLHPGKFYALPQAPQQFKQLLMVSGFDRYFQIAPCFRDEDARADRSPGEFYQIDLEMSFVEEENVLQTIEQIAFELFSKFANGRSVTPRPFPRIKYLDSIRDYGSDKPDLRNPLKLQDVSEIFKNSSFKVFQGALERAGSVRLIPLPVKENPARSYFDGVVDWYKKLTGEGLAYLTIDPSGEAKGSIAKFVSSEELSALKETLKITSLTCLFFAAGANKSVLAGLGKLRDKLAQDYNLINKDSFELCLITDYPMYEWDEINQKIDFAHNPFSMPNGGMEALLNKEPLEIFAHQYDVVCNGFELGSGAIRNHNPDIMYKAFELVGYDNSVVDHKFGGMIKAFKFGAPPHGGFAFGIDRIIMLVSGEDTIREIIAFPLAQNGEDLLMNAPSDVSDKQLKDVHIKLDLPAKKL